MLRCARVSQSASNVTLPGTPGGAQPGLLALARQLETLLQAKRRWQGPRPGTRLSCRSRFSQSVRLLICYAQ